METGNEEAGDNNCRKARFVFHGSNAQTQTSYEVTLFPIGFAALRKFCASFQGVKTDYIQPDAIESSLHDSLFLSMSASCIADLIENFEIAVPGPSRGDRGSLMICCVCQKVYPEDHQVAWCWCGKIPLCLYRCGGLHAR